MRGYKVLMLAVFFLTFGALQLGAQFSEPKFEITPFGGTRFGGKISYSPPATYTGPGSGSGGELLDYIGLKSSFDYGVYADYSLMPGFQAEFVWSRQPTELRAHGAVNGQVMDIGPANLDNYNWGMLWELKGEESKIKPFIGFGLGFTHFGTNGVLTGINNRFSYNFGGGVKYEPTPHVGLRLDVRYSPTHTTQQVAYGQDFYGNLYQTQITNKANQGQANIGVIFRF